MDAHCNPNPIQTQTQVTGTEEEFLHLPAQVARVLDEVEVPGQPRERLHQICYPKSRNDFISVQD